MTVVEVVRGAGAMGVEQVVVVLAVGDVVGDGDGATEPAGERGLGADMVRVHEQCTNSRAARGSGCNAGAFFKNILKP